MDDTKGNMSTLKDEDEDTCTSVISNQDSNMAKETPNITEGDDDGEKLPWPTMSDLNTRLRRIITSFQRSHKRQMLKDAQRAKVCYKCLTYCNRKGNVFPIKKKLSQYLRKRIELKTTIPIRHMFLSFKLINVSYIMHPCFTVTSNDWTFYYMNI